MAHTATLGAPGCCGIFPVRQRGGSALLRILIRFLVRLMVSFQIHFWIWRVRVGRFVFGLVTFRDGAFGGFRGWGNLHRRGLAGINGGRRWLLLNRCNRHCFRFLCRFGFFYRLFRVPFRCFRSAGPSRLVGLQLRDGKLGHKRGRNNFNFGLRGFVLGFGLGGSLGLNFCFDFVRLRGFQCGFVAFGLLRCGGLSQFFHLVHTIENRFRGILGLSVILGGGLDYGGLDVSASGLWRRRLRDAPVLGQRLARQE